MNKAFIRGLIDLFLTITFVVVLVTGIGLYFAPSGRIAATTGWTFLGLDKETLTEIHTYAGFFMGALVGLHITLGYKSMITLLKTGFKRKKKK